MAAWSSLDQFDRAAEHKAYIDQLRLIGRVEQRKPMSLSHENTRSPFYGHRQYAPKCHVTPTCATGAEWHHEVMHDERGIFTFLFDLAETSKDPEGVVAACLLRDGRLLASSASSDDGRHHAEYRVLQSLREHGVTADGRCVLYTTLVPCSDASGVNDGRDCTTNLLDAGVRHVIFAADDPEYGKSAKARFHGAGGTCRQTGDLELVRRTEQIFNATISRDLSDLHLPRERKLERDT